LKGELLVAAPVLAVFLRRANPGRTIASGIASGTVAAPGRSLPAAGGLTLAIRDRPRSVTGSISGTRRRRSVRLRAGALGCGRSAARALTGIRIAILVGPAGGCDIRRILTVAHLLEDPGADLWIVQVAAEQFQAQGLALAA
jgi:hypothetical protein